VVAQVAHEPSRDCFFWRRGATAELWSLSTGICPICSLPNEVEDFMALYAVQLRGGSRTLWRGAGQVAVA